MEGSDMDGFRTDIKVLAIYRVVDAHMCLDITCSDLNIYNLKSKP
jgi:hypothetical protein